MRWDDVARAVVAALNADAALTTALGGQHVYPASAAREVRIPSVEWFMVTDRYDESRNPMIMQIDLWAKGQAVAVTIEERIRAVLHSDVRRVFAGTDCETSYIESRSHDHPDPGVVHRSLDFRFEPVREQYAPA